METAVTSAQMQACDRHAVTKLGIPASLLMENAGRRVAETALRLARNHPHLPIVILCGKGNNGGDGLVAARHLISQGIAVRVGLVFGDEAFRGETRMNFNVLRKMMGAGSGEDPSAIIDLTSGNRFRQIGAGSVVVDAVFGTGFHGRVKGRARMAVEWINRQSAKIVSVDIPSGLNADTGSISNTAVKADVTVTMGLRKIGLITGSGPRNCGQIIVANLGFPPFPVPSVKKIKTGIVHFDDFQAAVPRRPFDAHKHSVGKILVIAGSIGLTGAAALAAESAMRTGAGAVILATPGKVYPILARKLTEVMVKPVGGRDEDTFTGSSAELLRGDLDWADVIILGPGIGRTNDSTEFVKKLLKTSGKRFLIDADGLTILAGLKGLRSRLRANECILTPHSGEFSRITGKNTKYIENNRVETARTFAESMGVHLVLKGAPTVTATPDGEVFINTTGNEGMASAGMGDVLSGTIGALWGESGDARKATYAGVYLHGLAGDRASVKTGKRSIIATDVLREMPLILSNIVS